jgi:hypothetical protein
MRERLFVVMASCNRIVMASCTQIVMASCTRIVMARPDRATSLNIVLAQVVRSGRTMMKPGHGQCHGGPAQSGGPP